MATPIVLATHLETSSSAATATSFNTGSISPSVRNLIIVAIANGTSAAGPPTVTGNGFTYDQIITKVDSAVARRITLYRAMGENPSAGVVTVDYGVQSVVGISWSIAQFSGVNRTGLNGVNAIAQTASNENSGAQTGITVTLGAFSSSNNATYGAVRWGGSSGITPGTGFSELGETAPASTLESEWVNSNDTTVDWSWASASQVTVAVALEIIAYQNISFGNKLRPAIFKPGIAR